MKTALLAIFLAVPMVAQQPAPKEAVPKPPAAVKSEAPTIAPEHLAAFYKAQLQINQAQQLFKAGQDGITKAQVEFARACEKSRPGQNPTDPNADPVCVLKPVAPESTSAPKK